MIAMATVARSGRRRAVGLGADGADGADGAGDAGGEVVT
jgi:hypothetical protein